MLASGTMTSTCGVIISFRCIAFLLPLPECGVLGASSPGHLLASFAPVRGRVCRGAAGGMACAGAVYIGCLALASASFIPPALDGGRQRRQSWPATTQVPVQAEAVWES